MSIATNARSEMPVGEVTLKDEAKMLRGISARANADRRQGHSAVRLSLTPRVLRRSDASAAPQA